MLYVIIPSVDNKNNALFSVTGFVTTIAGTPMVSGSSNGNGMAARFNEPFGITIDNGGNLYVADSRNNLVRAISPSGERRKYTSLSSSSLFVAVDCFHYFLYFLYLLSHRQVKCRHWQAALISMRGTDSRILWMVSGQMRYSVSPVE